MIWSQEITGGKLLEIGAGDWSGKTFKASTLKIGGRNMQNIRVSGYLLDHLKTGEEVCLLICSAHIYGVRTNGQTYREGAIRQLGWALLIAMTLGWIFMPLAAFSAIFVRRAYAIYSFR